MKKIKFKELEKIAKENAAKAENDTYKQFLEEKIWENLSSSEKLIKINKEPFSSEKEILEEINGYYSFKNLSEGEYSFIQGYLYSLRDFLITGHLYLNNEHIENKDLLKSLKTHFFKNKKSKNLKIKSIVNILSLVGVEDFYEYLGPQIRIKEIDWHKKYLKKYLQTHKEETDFYEKFISSSFYDADLKFSVSNRENKLKIVWKLDQSFIGSDEEQERGEAVSALFDLGNIMEYLGKFKMSRAPKVIKENIFKRHRFYKKEEIDKDKKKKYLPVKFHQLLGKSNSQICKAWMENKIGKKTVKRGKKYISIEWQYPKSFKPHRWRLIRIELESIFSQIAVYMFSEYDKDIMNMIRYSFGEFDDDEVAASEKNRSKLEKKKPKVNKKTKEDEWVEKQRKQSDLF